jgi:hypothetical protein
LGFERFEIGDSFDMLGFHDFYLFLKETKYLLNGTGSIRHCENGAL